MGTPWDMTCVNFRDFAETDKEVALMKTWRELLACRHPVYGLYNATGLSRDSFELYSVHRRFKAYCKPKAVRANTANDDKRL